MPFLTRNVALGKPLKLSAWRKTAIGTWRRPGDPSVYGIIDLDAEPALAYLEQAREKSGGAKVTLTHFVGRAVAEVFKRHPHINCILRFGRLYPRLNVDVFFQVASDDAGEDLSGMTVRQADTKSIGVIAREMNERVRKIKARQDETFKKSKDTLRLLPGWAVGWVLDFLGWFTYTLNLWTPLLGSPRDPFGTVMVTNIGSLGLETAFAPIVPYSRVPILIAVGSVKDAPVVKDGALAVGKMLRICVTFDHRLIDGMHAANMTKTLKKVFADPARELGEPV